MQLLLILAAAALSVTPSRAAEYFAAPDGKPTGNGTIQAPWDLVTAIGKSAVVRPGDTLNLRGGTYVTPSRRAIFITLSGSPGNPVTVRPSPSEHAVIDGGFYVTGSWLIVRDLEIASSLTRRTTSYSGSFPSDITTPSGIEVTGTNVKIVNNVVHDMSTGVASWKQASDNEFYGNLVYYNGWLGPDRPHGHGAYMQNTSGRKLLHDNIFFSGFELGLQLYGSASTFLNNFELEGNIIFKSGELGGRSSRNILIGGDVVAANPVLRDNYTYFPTSVTTDGENNVGYWPNGTGCSNLIVENNYMVGGATALALQKCTVNTMRGNTFFGDTKNWTPATYPGNFVLGRVRPTTYRAFVRPNKYESGRANIAIFNWTRLATVPVDLSGIGLIVGDAFEIRDAQNFYGPSVWQGVFTGAPIDIPMTSTAVAQPVGNVPYKPTHSDMEFGAFIVMKLKDGSTPPPPAFAITGPAVSGVTTSGATLTWTTNTASSTAVEYGPTTALGQTSAVIPALTTGHAVTLTGLTAGTTYYTRLVSTDAASKTAEDRTLTFTTVKPPPPSAPTISGAAVSGITTSGATLTWTTSTPTSTTVEYGTTSVLGLKTAVIPALTTGHAVTLTGLTAGTTYYTRLASTDAASQTAENRTLTFATATATPAPTPTPVPAVKYTGWTEAENGNRAYFPIVSDASVSGRKYIYAEKNEAGTVTYNVYTSVAGTFTFWFRARAKDSQSASFYLSLNASPEAVLAMSPSPTWQWVRLSNAFVLKAGWHKLILRSRQAHTAVDGFLLTNDLTLIPTDRANTTIR